MARIRLKVQPGAKRQRVAGKTGTEWKIAVTAPPADGRANEACIVFLAELCGVPKSSVRLLRGAGSRTKTFEIDGLAEEAIDEIFTQESA